MGGDRKASAPALLRGLVGLVLPARDRASQLSELDELFHARVKRMGSRRAWLWYARQVPAFWWRTAVYALKRRGRGGSAPSERPARVVVDSFFWDLHRVVRGLVRRPGYSLAAIVTLGVGIGGSVAVFSVANWVLLRPVPGVRAPGELVRVRLESTEFQGSGLPISHPDYEDLAEGVFGDGVAAVANQEVHLSVGTAAPERAPSQIVTARYFEVLGVRLSEGRGFVAEEEGAGTAVVVVGEQLQRRYGRDALRPGSSLLVNGRSYRVIGVAPPGFRGADLPGRAELWFPAGALPLILNDPGVLESRGRQVWSEMVARPASRRVPARLEQALAARVEGIRSVGGDHSFLSIRYAFRVHEGIGFDPALKASVTRTLLLLGAASLLLFALACANAANLGLARSESLRSALVVRRALGASVGRIAGERLLENTVIGAAGSVVGVAVGAAAIRALEGASLARGSTALQGVGLDARVLTFAMTLALLSGMITGVLPALAASRQREMDVLRATRQGQRRAPRVRGGLVVAQIALSVVLVVSAGLLERTLWNLRGIDTGVAADGVLTLNVDPGLHGYDAARRLRFIDDLLRRVAEQPDVLSAGGAFVGAYESLHIPLWAMRVGGTRERDGVAPRSFHVAGDFFGTLGLRLIAGRFFDASEMAPRDSAAPWIVILNESAARAFFPELDPAQVPGQLLQPAMSRPSAADVRTITVVGVVRDARLGDVAQAGEQYAFVPWGQGYVPGWATVYVRTITDGQGVAGQIRQVLNDTDASLPAFRMGSLRERMDAQLVQQRFVATLSLLLGTLGVGLAALGAYAVLAYSVVERTREIGIRSALGARPASLVTLVVRDALFLSAVGTVFGLLGAALASRFLEARLFGIERLDPATFAAGAAVMLVTALAASAVPAARAARLDVTEALRRE